MFTFLIGVLKTWDKLLNSWFPCTYSVSQNVQLGNYRFEDLQSNYIKISIRTVHRMRCWRRLEISWTDRVKNEEVLHRVKEERNIRHTIERRERTGLVTSGVETAFWNTLLKIEGTSKRGRIRKQLLDNIVEKKVYWKLKEEALDRTLWRTRFGKGYGPVTIHTKIRLKRPNVIEIIHI
jgi:hypothetical protein